MFFSNKSMSMSSVEDLQFAMHRAAYSHNDVKLIITLTRNSSKPGNSKTQQGFQLNTQSTVFRNSHGMHFNCN